MTADQLMGVLRALLAASGPVAAVLVQIFGVEEGKARAALDLASALLTILTPLIAAWWSTRVHSTAAKIASLEATPGLKVLVDPATAPPAAVAAARDPTRPDVVAREP